MRAGILTGVLPSLIATATLLVPIPAQGRDEPRAHPDAFWLALREKEFKLAPGESTLPLALEAARLLGSTDPRLRDAVAYEALETWIYGRPSLDAAQLETLRATLTANAQAGLGEREDDRLFLRSFSILVLSVLAAADLKQPVLDSVRFDGLIELALDELARERDLRGYIPDKGWGHATAHCADLLKFLARNPRLRPEQQARIVSGIEERLRSAGIVFIWGEEARLAAALASLARRADADAHPFEQWFERLIAEHQAVWTGAFEPTRYAAVRAQLNALSQLSAELESDAAPGSMAQIREALRKMRAATR